MKLSWAFLQAEQSVMIQMTSWSGYRKGLTLKHRTIKCQLELCLLCFCGMMLIIWYSWSSSISEQYQRYCAAAMIIVTKISLSRTQTNGYELRLYLMSEFVRQQIFVANSTGVLFAGGSTTPVIIRVQTIDLQAFYTSEVVGKQIF